MVVAFVRTKPMLSYIARKWSNVMQKNVCGIGPQPMDWICFYFVCRMVYMFHFTYRCYHCGSIVIFHRLHNDGSNIVAHCLSALICISTKIIVLNLFGLFFFCLSNMDGCRLRLNEIKMNAMPLWSSPFVHSNASVATNWLPQHDRVASVYNATPSRLFDLLLVTYHPSSPQIKYNFGALVHANSIWPTSENIICAGQLYMHLWMRNGTVYSGARQHFFSVNYSVWLFVCSAIFFLCWLLVTLKCLLLDFRSISIKACKWEHNLYYSHTGCDICRRWGPCKFSVSPLCLLYYSSSVEYCERHFFGFSLVFRQATELCLLFGVYVCACPQVSQSEIECVCVSINNRTLWFGYYLFRTHVQNPNDWNQFNCQVLPSCQCNACTKWGGILCNDMVICIHFQHCWMILLCCNRLWQRHEFALAASLPFARASSIAIDAWYCGGDLMYCTCAPSIRYNVHEYYIHRHVDDVIADDLSIDHLTCAICICCSSNMQTHALCTIVCRCPIVVQYMVAQLCNYASPPSQNAHLRIEREPPPIHTHTHKHIASIIMDRHWIGVIGSCNYRRQFQCSLLRSTWVLLCLQLRMKHAWN